MIGYRKIIGLFVAIIAEALLLWRGITVPEEIQNQLVGLVIYIIEILAIPGVAAGYMVANVKAKKYATSNGAVAMSGTPAIPLPTFNMLVPPSDAILASLGAPLDIQRLLDEAEKNRKSLFNYKWASTVETGLYYAFRDIGNATATTSLEHCLQFFDKLAELAQASWLAETTKALGPKVGGFSWDDKEMPENLEKGYSPGCHALDSYSWARHFSLSGHYRGINADLDGAFWLNTLESDYPNLDLASNFGANSTLYRVGVNARGFLEGHQPRPKPKKGK